MCAYTEARWGLLVGSVRSVCEQHGIDVQVVLVIDHNEALLDRARAEWPSGVSILPNTGRRGLSGARNTGVEVAEHEIVAFLDDDAHAESGWLAALCRHFADPAVGGVGGRVLPAWLDGAPAWFPDEFLWVVGCSYLGLPVAVAEVRNPIGANMAFRRSVLAETGGFREEIGRVGDVPVGCEETELSIRARTLGSTILYEPGAVVRHAVPADRGTMRYFTRRCLAEGRSKAVVATMVDPTQALSSERAYATRTLPAGVARGLRGAVRGPDRAAYLGRVGAIPIGLAVTAAGYADARLRRRRAVSLGEGTA